MTSSEYNKCVDEYSDRVFRFILKNMRNKMDAEDVVQTAFANLWKHHKNVDFKKAKSYIFTSAYNAMIDYIRKRKNNTYFEDGMNSIPTYQMRNHDVGEIIKRAVDTLPEIQRTVILLRDYEGYSYKEIGEIVNLNESQVKVYIFRARQKLKEYIGRLENVI